MKIYAVGRMCFNGFCILFKILFKISTIKQFLNPDCPLVTVLSTRMLLFIASSEQLSKVDTIVHFTPEETEHRSVK